MPENDPLLISPTLCAAMLRRTPKLEGTVAQLRAEGTRTVLVTPTIRDIQALEKRVQVLENEGLSPKKSKA